MKGSDIVIIAIVVAFALAGPLLVIWALNTVFALDIEYSFLNWLAISILMSIIPSRVASSTKSLS